MRAKRVLTKLSQVLLVVGALLLVIAGCAKKTEKTSFQKIANGVDSRVTYYYQDDKVTKQTTSNKITYTSLRVNNKAEAKKAVKDEVQKYNDTKGVTDKITYHDTYLQERVVVDLNKASVSDFLKLAGTYSNSSSSKKKYISFEKSEKLIKDQGFSKVSDGKYKNLPKKDLKVRKAITMDQYNSIKITYGSTAGTTVTEMTKKLGKPDTTPATSSGSYTWYTNYTKTGYLRVTVNDKKEATSKFMLQPTVENTKFSEDKYNQINKEIPESELLEKMGEPYQVTTYSSREMIYYITKDSTGQTIQNEYVFQVENGKVTGKQSKEG